MRQGLSAVLGLVYVAFAGPDLPSFQARAASSPGLPFASGTSPDKPARLFDVLDAPLAWRNYQSRFVESSGRVIDTANDGISHSEGQGYGMLLAVAAGDHDAFRRIWQWTRNKMMRPHDALIAWRWNPAKGKIEDLNNASDGDILIAWALGEADEAWPHEGYRADAHRIAADVAQRTFAKTRRYGLLLLPAVVGYSARDRSDGPIVNLSYWVFPAFPRLAALAPEFDWAELARSGLKMIHEARFGPARLPTDWVAVGGDVLKPAAGWPATFSYNAVRIPLYLAMAGDKDKDDYEPFAAEWARDPPGRLPIVEVSTGRALGWMQEPGYVALAAATRCVVSGNPVSDDVFRPTVDENYYPATLGLLAKLALRLQFADCLAR